jgi:hypothetical protein
MMCSRRSKSLDEEERGVGLGNCPWGTGGSCVSEAPYRARHIRKLDPPWPACAKSVRKKAKNGLILLVIRGVDAGDDRS